MSDSSTLNLKEKNCIPCQGGVPPLELQEKQRLLEQINSRWMLSKDQKQLSCSYQTKEFADGMELANKIAKMADEQWHHPVLTISFGKLDIMIWTHKINDLVESDFIFAVKVDELLG